MSAKVLSAMLVIFLCCAGCVLPAPPGAILQPAASATPPCAACEDPYIRHSGLELAVAYIENHYPEQVAGLGSGWWQGDDWIIENSALNPSWVGPVIVANTATGFRWEGDVRLVQESPSGGCCWGYIVNNIFERSVVLPTPGVPTGTPGPAATATGLVPR
jgi:hypothetical protein